jgi:hypothetical protein
MEDAVGEVSNHLYRSIRVDDLKQPASAQVLLAITQMVEEGTSPAAESHAE